MQPYSAPLPLQPRHWYAWQCISADDGADSYFSPVYLKRIVDRGGLAPVLTLAIANVLHLDQPQDEILSLRTIRHDCRLLIADVLEPGGTPSSTVIVTPITFGWLRRHAPHVTDQYPSALLDHEDTASADRYLGRAFPYVTQPCLCHDGGGR
ncbi:hypothetical protein [Modicisalibacter radicis]|uniref:hypothetical protein n=1 Tax=Halomonas sp. EAR18 TaxID=2518972 RepID=UPI00109CC447|nr:hypothetical protein [Halomonas sp. EAR18]